MYHHIEEYTIIKDNIIFCNNKQDGKLYIMITYYRNTNAIMIIRMSTE